MKEEKIIVPANGYLMLFVFLILFFVFSPVSPLGPVWRGAPGLEVSISADGCL